MASSTASVDLSIHLDPESLQRLDSAVLQLQHLAEFITESARVRRPLPSDETQVVRTPVTDETAVLRGIGMPEFEPWWVNGYTCYVNGDNEENWVKDGDLPAPSWRQLYVEKRRQI
jgi:hypothetical protein